MFRKGTILYFIIVLSVLVSLVGAGYADGH